MLADAPAATALAVAQGTVELLEEPPAAHALRVAMEAAVAVADAEPGPGLVAWLRRVDQLDIRWDAGATAAFVRVLRGGTPRSWRLLTVSGVLGQWLPELAGVVRARLADVALPDPLAPYRWRLVEGLVGLEGAAEHRPAVDPDLLLLAALAVECASETERPSTVAGRLARRWGVGRPAEDDIAFLVAEHGLLAAAARRPDGLGEEAVLRLAAHVDRPERVHALYLLARAAATVEGRPLLERRALYQLYELVQRVLVRHELQPEGRNVVERRRSDAARLVGSRSPAATRVRAAPPAYVLSQESPDIARHCELLEPAPATDDVRVAVTPTARRHEWQLDICARDRVGLLAGVTGVLAVENLDVLHAVVATWDDGVALESFRVRADEPPDPAVLRGALRRSLGGRLVASPEPDAEVRFDDEASPWHTLCDIRAPDRPGLLHALATAFASARVDVHAAKVATVDGVAVDRFDLTDRKGRKLGAAEQAAVRATLAAGATLGSRRWRLSRQSGR